MHVLILTPGFAEDEGDTTCLVYLQKYVQGLIHRGVRVTILTLHYPMREVKYSWHGAEVTSLGGSNIPYAQRLPLWRKAINRAKSLIRSNGCQVMHSMWLRECTLLGSWISRSCAIPHIFTAMGTDVLPHINRFLWFRMFFRGGMVFVSDFHRSQYPYKGQAEQHIIPWGMPSYLGPIKQEREIDILFVGFMSEVKRGALFLEVLRQVVDQRPDLRVMMVGEDYSGGVLEERIRQLGLEQICQMTGLMENAAVLELMGRSKTLVHTSRFESQGFVFMEALSRGMNIVSMRVGLAQDRREWVCVEHVHEFPEAILRSLQASHPRQAINLMPVETCVDRYLQVYEAIT
ncbi:MAG: glycosyltransferase family 4 protein [Saprospiraceae bacterium]|nr:glycosyltransferase family 4 protein [Saprospiraceae bacterium]